MSPIVQSRFVDFDYIDGNGEFQSYSGKTPPNVPSFVANAGASYRFDTAGRSKSAPRCAMSATASISRTIW